MEVFKTIILKTEVFALLTKTWHMHLAGWQHNFEGVQTGEGFQEVKLGQEPVRHPAYPELNTSMKLSLHFREAGCKLLSPFSSTLSRSVLSLRLSFIPERGGKAAYCFFCFFFFSTSKCSGKSGFNETFSVSPGSTYWRRGKRPSRGVSWGQAHLWKEGGHGSGRAGWALLGLCFSPRARRGIPSPAASLAPAPRGQRPAPGRAAGQGPGRCFPSFSGPPPGPAAR